MILLALLLGTQGLSGQGGVPQNQILKQASTDWIWSGAQVERGRKYQMAMDQLTNCLIRQKPKLVSEMLNSLPGSSRAANIITELSDVECSAEGIDFDETALRGAFFNRLCRASNGVVARCLPSNLPVIDYKIGTTNDREVVFAQLREIADCVVRLDAQKAYMFSRSELGAAAAATLAADMQQHVKQCQQVERARDISSSALRGLVAEVVYRMAKLSNMPTNAGVR